MDDLFNRILGIQINIQQVIQLGALILARLTPALFQTPFMGGEVIQSETKMGISFILLIYFYPAVTANLPYPLPAETSTYVMLLVKEFFVGFVMGYLASLPFNYIASVGNQVDTARGASQGQIQNPGLSEDVTLTSNHLYWMMVFLFLAANGHHLYIQGVARSFSIIPLTAMPDFQLGFTPFVAGITRLTAEMFVVTVQLAAPVMIVCLITDVVFGLFNRIASQMQVGDMSQVIKLLAGLWVFFLSLPLVVRQMYRLLDEMLGYSLEMLQKM